MPYIDKLHNLASRLEPASIIVLFSSDKKIRNRDVYYNYRNTSDLIYLTGYNEPDMILCLTAEGKTIIYMKYPDMKIEQWTGKMLAPGNVQADLKLDEKDVRESKNFWTDLPLLLKNRNVLYLDFNSAGNILPKFLCHINELNKNTRDAVSGPVSVCHINDVLHESRVIKSLQEIEKIKEALRITCAGFIDVMKYTRNADALLYEYSVKSRIESKFNGLGAMNLAYPTIVASGNNANYLHYENYNRVIQPTDLILIDAGCEWRGYASDVTRTFPCKGKFTTPQKQIYEIVLEAQKDAIDKCMAGNTFETIHEIALRRIVEGLWGLGLFSQIMDINSEDRKLINPVSIDEIIEKKYYRVYYMHYTSHFIGLDVHDVGKYFINGASRKLQAGMVITVEPGIYISEEYDFVEEKFRGIGVRIEDDILITDTGNEILSKNIPKEINEIEFME